MARPTTANNIRKRRGIHRLKRPGDRVGDRAAKDKVKFGGLTIEQINRVAKGEQFAIRTKNSTEPNRTRNGKIREIAEGLMDGKTIRKIEREIGEINPQIKSKAIGEARKAGWFVPTKRDAIEALLRAGVDRREIKRGFGFTSSYVEDIARETGGLGKVRRNIDGRKNPNRELAKYLLGQGIDKKTVGEITGYGIEHLYRLAQEGKKEREGGTGGEREGKGGREPLIELRGGLRNLAKISNRNGNGQPIRAEKEQIETLRRAMEKLTPEERELIENHYYGGETLTDIGNERGYGTKANASLKHRNILERLGRLMAVENKNL